MDILSGRRCYRFYICWGCPSWKFHISCWLDQLRTTLTNDGTPPRGFHDLISSVVSFTPPSSSLHWIYEGLQKGPYHRLIHDIEDMDWQPHIVICFIEIIESTPAYWLRLIWSFLSDKPQCVDVNSTKSDCAAVTSGVQTENILISLSIMIHIKNF